LAGEITGVWRMKNPLMRMRVVGDAAKNAASPMIKMNLWLRELN
jgi:hypothetical protein